MDWTGNYVECMNIQSGEVDMVHREVFNSGLLYKGRGHSCSMQQRVMIVIVRMGEGGKDEKGGKPERLCGVVGKASLSLTSKAYGISLVY